MKQYTMSANVLTLWRARILIAFALIGGISVGLAFISYWFLLVPAAALAAAIYFSFWFCPRLVKNYKITVCNEYIKVTRGVYILTENIMPSPRLVYAQRLTTPLSSRLGLCVFTLSAARSRIIIGSIAISDAQEIMGLLNEESGV